MALAAGCFITLYSGMLLARRSVGTIPNYDALSYVVSALNVHFALLGPEGLHPLTLSWQSIVASLKATLPFTSTLDVLLLALLWDFADLHILVLLLHTAYLAIFLYLVRRYWGNMVAATAFFAIVATPVFFTQYTQFISEMKVGLMVALLLGLLFDLNVDAKPRHIALAAFLLLLARLASLSFIVAFALLWLLRHWRERRSVKVWTVIGAMLLPLLTVALCLPENFLRQYEYIRHHSSEGVKNWQLLTGIHSKLDLLQFYLREVWRYNEIVVALCIFLSVLAAMQGLRRGNAVAPRTQVLRTSWLWIGMLAVGVIMMSAAYSNGQIVFWVYASLVMASCIFVARNSGWLARLQLLVIAAVAAFLLPQRLNAEFAGVARYQPLTPVARAIAADIRGMQDPVLYANFFGMGPLDIDGIALAAARPLGMQNADDLVAFTEGIPEDRMSAALGASNVLLLNEAAKLWPKYIGVNTLTKQRYDFLRVHAPEHGFTLVNRHFIEGDFKESIEVWIKPYVNLTGKYAAYDKWLDRTTPLSILHPTIRRLENYRLDVDVTVRNPKSTGFSPPFEVRMLDGLDREVARTRIVQFGENRLCFDFSGVTGTYTLVSDKTFVAPPDPRALFAQYRASRLQRGSCR